MKIAIASDHGGFELKEFIKEHLSAKTPESAKNLEIIDLGTDSEESVDYPLYGKLCGETVASGKADLGIVLCGTGIGISIAANKVRGIRCGLCTSVESIITPISSPSAEERQSQSSRLRSSTHGWTPNLKEAVTSAEWICWITCKIYINEEKKKWVKYTYSIIR